MERSQAPFRWTFLRTRGMCRFRLAVIVPLFLLTTAGIVYVEQLSTIHALMTRLDRLERSHGLLLAKLHQSSDPVLSNMRVVPPTYMTLAPSMVYNTPPLQTGDKGGVTLDYPTRDFVPEIGNRENEENEDLPDEEDAIIIPNRPEVQNDAGLPVGESRLNVQDQGYNDGQLNQDDGFPNLNVPNDGLDLGPGQIHLGPMPVQNEGDLFQQQQQQQQQLQQQQQQQLQLQQPLQQNPQLPQPNPQLSQQEQQQIQQNQVLQQEYQQRQNEDILQEAPSIVRDMSAGRQMAPKITPQQADNSNKELVRFQAMVNSWPQGKPKAVIFYLLNARRIAKFREAIQSLDRFFNSHYRYPVILFHETDLVESHKKIIRTWTISDIYFQILDFSIPEWVDRPPEEWLHTCGFAGLDSRHLCRFFGVLLPDQPILQGIDWYWRLGDDAILLSDVTYDVFQHMEEHDFTHGYVRLAVAKTTDCIEGLRTNSTRYTQQSGLRATFLDRLPETLSLYPNFEISRFSFWRNPMVKAYISYIDKTGGIYYKHWGDGAVKTTALAIFESIDKIVMLSDIKYQQKTGASDENQIYISSLEKYLIPSVL